MTTNFKRTFGNATSPLALSYLDDNFAQLEAAGTSTVTLSGAQLIGFMQSGTGATSETVQAALRRIVALDQFDTLANYRTARDALSKTLGVNILQVTGTLAVGVTSSTEAVSGYTVSVHGTTPSVIVKCTASSGYVALSLFHTGTREWMLRTDSNDGTTFSIGYGTGNGAISTNWLRAIGNSTAINFGVTPAHFISGSVGTEIVHRIQSDPTGKVCSWELFRTVDDILNPVDYERVSLISEQVTANGFTLKLDSGGTGTTRNLDFYSDSTRMALWTPSGNTFGAAVTDAHTINGDVTISGDGVAINTTTTGSTIGQLYTTAAAGGEAYFGSGTFKGMLGANFSSGLIYIGSASNHPLLLATNNTERVRIDASGNVGIGTATFGTNAVQVLAIETGTAPASGPADTVQFYSSDNSSGNTIPSFYCEGTEVIATGQADSASSVRVKMRINGTVVTLLAI